MTIFRCALVSAISLLAFNSYSQNWEVSRDDWVSGMETGLPAAFCVPQQYFRQCFEVSARECEETALSATRICLNNYRDRIPATLEQPREGTAWGQKIGECAGRSFEMSMHKRKVNNPQCREASNWM